MIHPDTELRPAGDGIGLGVFATRPIPRGTIVWVLDELDQRLTPERLLGIGPRYRAILERYTWTNAAGERVLCWDIARWVNHSCEASALSSGWDFDVAVRDIAAGDEITNDYGALNLDRRFTCLCRQPSCRGRVRPEDFEKLADDWDERVRTAFPSVTKVEQPLWRFVPQRRLVTAAARDPQRVPSVRAHRYLPPFGWPVRLAARGA